MYLVDQLIHLASATNMAMDFVTTIDSDDEVSDYGGEPSRPTKTSRKNEDEADLDPDFEFDFGGGGNEGLDLWGGDEVRVNDKGKEVSHGAFEQAF